MPDRPTKTDSTAAQDRLGKALRANLLRRKAQSRAKSEQAQAKAATVPEGSAGRIPKPGAP
jgi:hypothetical protein